MERAAQSLWSALRRLARPEKPLDLLVAVWPLMVGRRLAAHTRPIAWNKGRVDVVVDEPEWHSQLESMGKDVQKQINLWWGSELVREVRFLPEKGKRPPSGRAGRTAVATRGKSSSAAEEQEVPLRTPAENKLGAALKELEPALRGIADEELRELIARVAAQYLGKQAKK